MITIQRPSPVTYFFNLYNFSTDFSSLPTNKEISVYKFNSRLIWTVTDRTITKNPEKGKFTKLEIIFHDWNKYLITNQWREIWLQGVFSQVRSGHWELPAARICFFTPQSFRCSFFVLLFIAPMFYCEVPYQDSEPGKIFHDGGQ